MIKVLIVDDQEIVRRGLKMLLEAKPDVQIVGEAVNGRHAIEQLIALEKMAQLPTVVVMDIRMPGMDGVEATQLICRQFPDIKVLVLTTFNDTSYVAEALRYGAKGYLLKDTSTDELAKAIRSIHQGYTQFGPGIVEKMIADTPATPPTPTLSPGLTNLTDREREVLRSIAIGASNREIAQTLHLSEGTVRNHISHVLTKLDVRDRTQAAILANSCRDWLDKA